MEDDDKVVSIAGTNPAKDEVAIAEVVVPIEVPFTVNCPLVEFPIVTVPVPKVPMFVAPFCAGTPESELILTPLFPLI